MGKPEINGGWKCICAIIEVKGCLANGKPDYTGKPVHVHRIKMLRDRKEHWDWVIRLRRAKLQIKYPKHLVDTSWAYFDFLTKEDQGLLSAYSKRKAAQAQVTKIDNALKSARLAYHPTLLEPKFEDSPVYADGIKKLEEAKKRLAEMEALPFEKVSKEVSHA